MKNQPSITVIIPAKNEEKTIGQVITSVKKYTDEIIVVDGYSRDNTGDIARKMGAKVILDHKKGKGDAVRTGINESKGDILVFIDADGSHESGDIPKMIEPIIPNNADMVIASRIKGGSDDFNGGTEDTLRMIFSARVRKNPAG